MLYSQKIGGSMLILPLMMPGLQDAPRGARGQIGKAPQPNVGQRQQAQRGGIVLWARLAQHLRGHKHMVKVVRGRVMERELQGLRLQAGFFPQLARRCGDGQLAHFDATAGQHQQAVGEHQQNACSAGHDDRGACALAHGLFKENAAQGRMG